MKARDLFLALSQVTPGSKAGDHLKSVSSTPAVINAGLRTASIMDKITATKPVALSANIKLPRLNASKPITLKASIKSKLGAKIK